MLNEANICIEFVVNDLIINRSISGHYEEHKRVSMLCGHFRLQRLPISLGWLKLISLLISKVSVKGFVLYYFRIIILCVILFSKFLISKHFPNKIDTSVYTY